MRPRPAVLHHTLGGLPDCPKCGEHDGREKIAGEVWSRFITVRLREAMASVGVSPKVETTDTSVIIRFARD